uniref:Uncharacterized protein n=1 Tax=Nelumbo nucifera TaxID=4432 RepID=A0A822XRZ4_NELNU|nr:TPA_asm: hypothetical protein HUJ06_023209 [Nelumbo nucifera]
MEEEGGEKSSIVIGLIENSAKVVSYLIQDVVSLSLSHSNILL